MAQHRDHLLGASFPTSLLVVARGHLKTELTFRNWKTSLKNPDSLLHFKNKWKKNKRVREKNWQPQVYILRLAGREEQLALLSRRPTTAQCVPKAGGAGATYLRCAVDILMAENTSLYSKASKEESKSGRKAHILQGCWENIHCTLCARPARAAGQENTDTVRDAGVQLLAWPLVSWGTGVCAHCLQAWGSSLLRCLGFMGAGKGLRERVSAEWWAQGLGVGRRLVNPGRHSYWYCQKRQLCGGGRCSLWEQVAPRAPSGICSPPPASEAREAHMATHLSFQLLLFPLDAGTPSPRCLPGGPLVTGEDSNQTSTPRSLS